MRRWFAFALVLALVSIAALPGRAQDLKIAAVVNDDVITVIDLVVRTRVALIASRLQDTPENRQRLAGVVLRSLIDERLKMQAAKAQGIQVEDSEVQKRLTALAEQNNATLDEFKARLEKSGILIDSLADQIRAELGWQMLVQRRFRNAVTVSRKDIDDEMAQIRQSKGKTEYLVAEIFLAVYNPSEASSVQLTAQDLMAQLKQGANFGALARQFSQSATASSGGLLGWLRPDQLDPEMRAAVVAMTPGQVTGPVQTSGGYSILTVAETRTAGDTPEDEQSVVDRLMNQRIDTLARGYLSDLRTQAYIDIRL